MQAYLMFHQRKINREEKLGTQMKMNSLFCDCPVNCLDFHELCLNLQFRPRNTLSGVVVTGSSSPAGVRDATVFKTVVNYSVNSHLFKYHCHCKCQQFTTLVVLSIIIMLTPVNAVAKLELVSKASLMNSDSWKISSVS